MKLNINIFRRKRKDEAYIGKYLNSRKPEGTAQKAVYISRTLNATGRNWKACASGKATGLSNR